MQNPEDRLDAKGFRLIGSSLLLLAVAVVSVVVGWLMKHAGLSPSVPASVAGLAGIAGTVGLAFGLIAVRVADSRAIKEAKELPELILAWERETNLRIQFDDLFRRLRQLPSPAQYNSASIDSA